MFTRRLWSSWGTEDVLQTTFKMYKQFSKSTTVTYYSRHWNLFPRNDSLPKGKQEEKSQDRLTLFRVIKFACRFSQIIGHENKIKY